jgi:mutator protein MutT
MERKIRCQGVIIQKNQLLLVQHVNHRSGSVYWWLPGGGVEPGETTEECVLREIREETNLEVKVIRLLFETYDMNRVYTYERFVTFLCQPIRGEPAPGTESESAHVHAITGLGWYSVWDETAWEKDFFEPHMLPFLRLIQKELKR